MFICDVCLTPIGPGIKPVELIDQTRPVSYHNEYFTEDEYGKRTLQQVDSLGGEIVSVLHLCDADAHKHYNIEIPSPKRLGTPPIQFREKSVDTFTVPLFVAVANNGLRRYKHTGKRAQRDVAVAARIVKQFVDRNPDIKL